MERGVWIGIFLGLVVTFSIFAVGFYSGNVATGYASLHNINEDNDAGGFFGFFGFRSAENKVVPQAVEVANTPVQENFDPATSAIQNSRSFGLDSDGKTITNGCDPVDLKDDFLESSYFKSGKFSGGEVCDFYKYDFCSEVKVIIKEDGSKNEVPCSEAISCSNSKDCINSHTTPITFYKVKCCQIPSANGVIHNLDGGIRNDPNALIRNSENPDSSNAIIKNGQNPDSEEDDLSGGVKTTPG